MCDFINSSFYKWGNKGPQHLNKLFEFTQLISGLSPPVFYSIFSPATPDCYLIGIAPYTVSQNKAGDKIRE